MVNCSAQIHDFKTKNQIIIIRSILTQSTSKLLNERRAFSSFLFPFWISWGRMLG